MSVGKWQWEGSDNVILDTSVADRRHWFAAWIGATRHWGRGVGRRPRVSSRDVDKSYERKLRGSLLGSPVPFSSPLDSVLSRSL